MDRRTLVGFLVLGSMACGTSSTPSAPSAPPASAPATSFLWSGTVTFSSVGPPGSCEALYLASHPELLAQTATADLQVNGDTAGMTVMTGKGQRCGFSGSASDGTLSVVTRHESCEGYPLSSAVLAGIVQACHTIDPIGDGPYWGNGTLTGRLTSSQLDGHWISAVYDPGGGSYGAMNVAIDLEVHLVRQ